MSPQNLVSDIQLSNFLAQHRLPAGFRSTVIEHYLPLASWIIEHRRIGEPTCLGINGAQGTGKSTLADFLRVALESGADWRVAVLSIDDFYLTRDQRDSLASAVHPMLRTRGVPGTHDIALLQECIENLTRLDEHRELALPRFDKSIDDRAPRAQWPLVTGPLDLIILEGWCVGSEPQAEQALRTAVNDLEASEDQSGDWRRYANDQLAGPYREAFAMLDALIFLQAPDFDAVYRWRLEQEEKLAETAAKGATGVMNSRQIATFIQNYERLTRANLDILPDKADVVLTLDDGHRFIRSHYATI